MSHIAHVNARHRSLSRTLIVWKWWWKIWARWRLIRYPHFNAFSLARSCSLARSAARACKRALSLYCSHFHVRALSCSRACSLSLSRSRARARSVARYLSLYFTCLFVFVSSLSLSRSLSLSLSLSTCNIYPLIRTHVWTKWFLIHSDQKTLLLISFLQLFISVYIFVFIENAYMSTATD